MIKVVFFNTETRMNETREAVSVYHPDLSLPWNKGMGERVARLKDDDKIVNVIEVVTK